MDQNEEHTSPPQGRPDVPLGPVLTGFSASPRRPAPNMPAVELRFSTPIGALHFYYPADGIPEVIRKLEEAKRLAELMPDPQPRPEVPNGHGGIVVPGQN